MSTAPEKEAILQEVQKINELIELFIHSTLEQKETGEAQHAGLFGDQLAADKRRCWEIKDCGQSDCACRTGDDYRCWLMAGTLNQSCCQGVFAQKYRTCYDCDVFKQFADTPINALYENINILIRHLVDKVKTERELAIKDGLTGLYNRYFLKMIEKGDIAGFIRKSALLSVIIFDLDMLKTVNDTHGHLKGDEMLKEFALFLKQHKREPDLLFRLGGDEFALLMSGVDEQQRIATEKRIAHAAINWNRRRKNNLPAPLSFSLGGATGFFSHSFAQIISEADHKMYAHKQSKQSECKISKAI